MDLSVMVLCNIVGSCCGCNNPQEIKPEKNVAYNLKSENFPS